MWTADPVESEAHVTFPASSTLSRRLRLASLLLMLLAGGAAQAADGVLVLGRISDDPRRHYEQLKPLLDYVVPRRR